MAYTVGRCLLRQLLRKNDMTQQELATRLNITKQQVQKYVKRESVMSLATAKSISEVLDVPIDDLYEWKTK